MDRSAKEPTLSAPEDKELVALKLEILGWGG